MMTQITVLRSINMGNIDVPAKRFWIRTCLGARFFPETICRYRAPLQRLSQSLQATVIPRAPTKFLSPVKCKRCSHYATGIIEKWKAPSGNIHHIGITNNDKKPGMSKHNTLQ
jgi:hypothetical protein